MDKQKKSKKLIISIIVFVVGLATLIAGVVFLVLNRGKEAGLRDGEYLVSAKEWVLEDNTNCLIPGEATDGAAEDVASESEASCLPGVIWKFSEIGKGVLTTNQHIDDYNFIWSLEDDNKLLIETEWLRTLEDEYTYQLDKGAGVLTLRNGENTYKFVAVFDKNE